MNGTDQGSFPLNGKQRSFDTVVENSFKGRGISSFVPFENSAVRLSGPKDFPVSKVSISLIISSISGGQNLERMELPGQVGGVGSAAGGSATKNGSKVFRKGVSFQVKFAYISA